MYYHITNFSTRERELQKQGSPMVPTGKASTCCNSLLSQMGFKCNTVKPRD